MIKRWFTALIGVPIFLIIMLSSFGNGIPALFLALIAGLILNFEVMSMVQNKKHISYNALLMSIAITVGLINTFLLCINIINITQFTLIHAMIFMVFFYIIIGTELIHSFDFKENLESIGFDLLIYVSLVIFFPLILAIKYVVPTGIAIFILFAFTWISDAMGLFTGKFIGKTKLHMLPSKSKTLEGYFGSIIFTTLLGLIGFYIQGAIGLPFHWSWSKWLLFGFMMSLSANFGDLTESLIKRWANVKDSSTLLPGMGGLFDAIDSQIYSAPIALLFFYM